MSTNVLYQMYVDKMGGRHIESFIADYGLIFYDPSIGALRIGDGVTPGGHPVYTETLGVNYDGGFAASLFGSGDFNFDGGSSATLGNSILDGGNA